MLFKAHLNVNVWITTSAMVLCHVSIFVPLMAATVWMGLHVCGMRSRMKLHAHAQSTTGTCGVFQFENILVFWWLLFIYILTCWPSECFVHLSLCSSSDERCSTLMYPESNTWKIIATAIGGVIGVIIVIFLSLWLRWCCMYVLLLPNYSLKLFLIFMNTDFNKWRLSHIFFSLENLWKAYTLSSIVKSISCWCIVSIVSYQVWY